MPGMKDGSEDEESSTMRSCRIVLYCILVRSAIILVLVAVTVVAAVVQCLRRRSWQITASETQHLLEEGGSEQRGSAALANASSSRTELRVTIGAQYNDEFLFVIAYEPPAQGDSTLRSQKKLFLNPECVPWLVHLATNSDLYLIVYVEDDEAEAMVRKALEEAELYECGLNPFKVVFCETIPGRISAVRQIEPQLHVDSDRDVISDLSRFIPAVAHVNQNMSSSSCEPAGNTRRIRSLAELF
ncbi:hypothetical protein NDN08_000292 [Rhodosorus marinus]|uniref:Uncharacterized protein n=1 Tax=Rhodosorus marinus TaxID=101924 RepID=A0AAV8URM1_9RHOD|nr:hypothetical protein NDN08_000292 [Rhodosorus marinus]